MPKVTTDTAGRPYVKLTNVGVGMTLECDAGFDCIKPGSHRRVCSAEDGLYIKCKSGRHYLTGQLDDNGYLVGLYKL